MKKKIREGRMCSEMLHPSYAGAERYQKEKGITFTDYYIIWGMWNRPCYMKFSSIWWEGKNQGKVLKEK